MSELLATARRALPVWILALLIVGVAELGARSVLGDDQTWVYWNRTMASKVRFLKRKEAKGDAPNVFILGDSTAAFNIIPSVLDERLGSHSFNLGSAGNYARSFDVVIRQHVLRELHAPELYVVSFAGRGFLPESKGQTERVLSSPIGQKLQGQRVWGDHLWLVRLHHLLRLYRDPPVVQTVFRNRGFEPYAIALMRRPRRPRMANQLPQPPEFLIRPPPPRPTSDEDPFGPLHRLFDDAEARGIQVVMVRPPSDEPVYRMEIEAVCQERGIPLLDYTDAPLPSHNSHLNVKGAKIYSKRLAKDLKTMGLLKGP